MFQNSLLIPLALAWGVIACHESLAAKKANQPLGSVFRAIVDPQQLERARNLAEGVKTTASEHWVDQEKPDKIRADQSMAVDGGFGPFSRWRTAGRKEGVWVELDFGRPIDFDTLRLYMTNERLQVPGLRVLAGSEPAPATEIFRADKSQAKSLVNRSVFGDALIELPPQNVRYLRVEFAAGTVHLDEIEVFHGRPQNRSASYEPQDARIRVRESVTAEILARDGDLLVWFENGAQKVFRDEVIKVEGPVTPVCSVAAARGETEPFQIVLSHPRGLRGIRLEAFDLKGPGKIPAANVRWYEVGYVYVRLPSVKLVTQLGRNEGLGKGWYPDYLLPVDSAEAPPGRQQPLWVDVDVPADAAPGDYQGELMLTADGDVRIPLELHLHVYDMAMPSPRKFKTMGRVDEIYGDMQRTKAWFKHLATLGFTGMSIFWPAPKIEDVGGRLRFDWTGFDEMADYCIRECHFDALALPGDVFAYHQAQLRPSNMVGRKNLKAGSPEFWASLEESLAEYGRHLAQKGWTDKFIFYICDEPNVVVFPYLLRVAEIARRKMPGVRILWIGGWVYPKLIGKFDIWGPNAKNFEIEAYAERFAVGDTIWTYSNALWLIDTPPLGARALGWAYAKYNISGLFFYSLNKWSPNPYEEPRNNPMRNGDPMFVYPDPQGRPDRFVNSIRIEMLRDGWDDWEYIRQLRERLKEAEQVGQGSSPAVAEAREALAAADGIVSCYGFPRVPNRDALIAQYHVNPDDVLATGAKTDPARFEYAHDAARLLKARDRVARAIEHLATAASTFAPPRSAP